jgi:tetratricopeptide (TPR) repeat protein
MITPHQPLAYPPEDPSQALVSDKLNSLRPLIGYGPESMYVAYNPFYPSDLAHYERRNASPDRSHNETFDALVITGMIGLAAYMVLFGSIFYFGLKWLGWIEDDRQKRAFLALFLLMGVLAAIAALVVGGPKWFGVGLPFGFTVGLVLYAILYALFRDRVELSAFALFWGVITLLAVAIVVLTKGGLLLIVAVLAFMLLIGALFYALGRAAFVSVQALAVQTGTGTQILILSLLVAIIAHFVEIHFGIAIAATRTYFWLFSALLVLVGKHMLEQRTEEDVSDAEERAGAEAAPVQRSTRRKRRRTARQSAPRPQRSRPEIPVWFGPVLASALVLALILGTLGFNFITNAGRISVDPTSCDPQVGRMLQPCWSSQAWNIIKHDLTVLPPNRNQNRPEETSSLMTLGLFFITLLIGSVIILSEMARRGLFKRRSADWAWATLLLLSIAVAVSLVVVFAVADRHLQLGRVQVDALTLSRILQETRRLEDLPNSIQGWLDVSLYLSSILVALYAFVLLFVLIEGLALVIGKGLPKPWATPWGAVAAIPLLLVALFIMNQTNLKVIRADIVYKQGEEWSRQKQWDLAIAHHKRALEMAPNEDFYYLWAGSAYLEKAKSAPSEGCFITESPDISGVLGMSIERTARLCQEDLLTAARTILFQARHVNPLNTDHSANLGRLYKNWADLSQSPEQRTQRIDQSIGYYDQASALSPQNTIVWNELATVYLYQQGNLAKAWETIQHSLELDDRFEQTYMIAGDARLRESEQVTTQLAAKTQDLAAAKGAEKDTIEAEIAQLEKEYGDKLEAAIQNYERALEIRSDLMNVYRTVAGAYEQLGRVDDAIATLEQAAAANLNSAEPYVGLAELYQRQNESEAAAAAYRRAVDVRPSDVSYRLALANLLESLGRTSEALEHVQYAAQLRPEDAALRQNLALMYQRLQWYPEALAEAQAAAQLAPNDPTPQLLIGDTSRLMEDLETAAVAYEKALTLAPDLENAWNVHLNLALIYQALDMLDVALEHATAALDAAPDSQRQQINDFIVQLEKQD